MARKIWRRSAGGIIDMTPEEEALRNQQIADSVAIKAVWKQEQAVKDARRESAKDKLEALGLTADEIKDTFNL